MNHSRDITPSTPMLAKTAAEPQPKFGALAHGVAHEVIALREALGRVRAVARTPDQAIDELQAMISERVGDLSNIEKAATPYRAEVTAKARQIVTQSLRELSAEGVGQ